VSLKADIKISHATTRVRCDGISNYVFIVNLMQSAREKVWLKWVNIFLWSYGLVKFGMHTFMDFGFYTLCLLIILL